MTTRSLDLTDPLVRRMAEFNHIPEENWRNVGAVDRHVTVTCAECGHDWPCGVRNRLRILADRESANSRPLGESW